MSEDVFRWVVAVGVLLACAASIWQAFVMAALYKAGKEAGKAGKEVQAKVWPLVDHIDGVLVSSSKLIEENRSRIASITTETLTTVRNARQQVERFGEVLDDANGRVKQRIAQIDKTVDETVVQVEQARDAVKTAVLKPVKEVNGLVAGMKAALSTYAQGGNRNPENVTQDEEMFI